MDGDVSPQPRAAGHLQVPSPKGHALRQGSAESAQSLGLPPVESLGAEAVRRSAPIEASYGLGSYGLGSSDSSAFIDGEAKNSFGGKQSSRTLGTPGRYKPSEPANRSKLDVIAAGHASRGGSEIQVDRPGTILKKLDATEREVYKRLKDTYEDDPVYVYTPEYHGDVKGLDESGKPVEFIRISNLLTGFFQPKVIDIKVGIRTFLESECDNPKPRDDLYKRMCELYPEDLTPEEREEQAITKYRWMSTRDAHTTISSMGFRIDGIAGYRKKPREQMDKTIASMLTHEDVCAVLAEFAQVAATDDGDGDPDDKEIAVDIAEEMLRQLEELYQACMESAFVKHHEFIGSSVLLIADAYGNVGVSWIDFAKTHSVPDGMELTHRSPWNLGNHEDGVLTGLANLLQAWQEVIAKLRADIPAMHALDSVFNGGRVPCFCTKWRESWKRKRRRERAAQLTQQSDMTILSALPAFQGENALNDGSALRHLVQMGADVVGAVAGETLQLAQHGAGAAVAVTTRGVEAAGTMALAAGTGVVDAAHAMRSGLRRSTTNSLDLGAGILRRGSARKGTASSSASLHYGGDSDDLARVQPHSTGQESLASEEGEEHGDSDGEDGPKPTPPGPASPSLPSGRGSDPGGACEAEPLEDIIAI